MTPSLCSGNNNNNFRIWWWWQGSDDRVDKRKSRTHKYHECAIGRTEIEQRGDRFSFLANNQIWISQWCHCTRIFNIGIHCNLIGCWWGAPSTRINRTSHVDRQDQWSLIDMWGRSQSFDEWRRKINGSRCISPVDPWRSFRKRKFTRGSRCSWHWANTNENDDDDDD